MAEGEEEYGSGDDNDDDDDDEDCRMMYHARVYVQPNK
jgi:hypothetical protein